MNTSNFDRNTIVKNNLSKIINYFSLDLQSDTKKYSGVCPIHNHSDNCSALIIYKNTGIWMCNTHHCENIFSKSAFGLLKALISSKINGWQDVEDIAKIASDASVYQFIKSNLNISNIENKIDIKNRYIYNEKKDFIKHTHLIKKNKAIDNRTNYRNNSIIPSKYYLKRNFSADILDKYDVGLYKNPKHPFYNRIVAPIYDDNYRYIIGYTARASTEKCLVCGYHHNFNEKCPDNKDTNKSPKWEHSKGFIKDKCLYNFWFAKNFIYDSIIICEGSSHIWRLVEAGFNNCVAIFGSNISKYQANLIKKTDATTIILPYDTDDAGLQLCNQIQRLLGNTYKYNIIDLPNGDIADLSINEVKKILK